MLPTNCLTLRLRSSGSIPLRCFTSVALPSGSNISRYRKIQRATNHNRIEPFFYIHSTSPLLRPSPFTDLCIHNSFSSAPRLGAISFKDLKSEDEPRVSPRQEPAKEEPETDPTEEAYQQATRQARERKAKADEERAKAREKERKDDEGDEANAAESDKKEGKRTNEPPPPPPPPPPHGSKTPWQVFTETLKTEFKASKEWNESTKQLASSAHQFTENESVKRAKAAYSAASGAATTGTASALKNTGKALGQGAAWTWDSAVVKGLRSGANAAGRGIDRATQPLRETEAFKSVRDVVDDGSSSKYGGWLEKEERRKRREQRELEEAFGSRRPGKRVEKAEEDPKYV